MGGDNFGVVIVGSLAAIISRALWGLLNGYLVAKAKIPPLIVTLGTLSVGPWPGPGDHRRHWTSA